MNGSLPHDLPLKGVRVVDYSHFLAGPFMGRCMAALGAEVIKVERPKAGDAGRAHPAFKDGQSGYFLQQNMGKQGLCVDLQRQARPRPGAEARRHRRRVHRELPPWRARPPRPRL